MAFQEISEKNCYSVNWEIHNYRYCWQKKDQSIASPVFSIFIPGETKWKLLLFPRGTSDVNNIAFFLLREEDCNGPDILEIEFQLELLKSDGSTFKMKETKKPFRKGSLVGCPKFLDVNDLLMVWRKMYLPQDILTVGCRIIRVGERPVETRKLFARTIINVEKRSLLWNINAFSSLTRDQKKSLVIKSADDEELITISLVLMHGQCFEESIHLNIHPRERSMKFLTLQTFLLSRDETKFDIGKFENCCEYGKFSNFQLKLSKNKLAADVSKYLPDDVLSLRLELAISTGFSFEGVTMIDFGTISDDTTNKICDNWRKCSVQEKAAEDAGVLMTDLMSLYENQTLCDVKLQTNTNVFLVHTTILCARSPVFRAMFSTDMKEKLNGLVDVSDFDDETVRHLILFLYTGKVEQLEWERVLRLYEAADKYEIISLKDRCSSFLKGNLGVKNACQVLILSDLHHDESLKTTAQDFILENGKEIFKSEEWKILEDTNSKLALKTALRNWAEK